MILNNIGRRPIATFRKINHYLEENHGFKISKNLGEADLQIAFQKVYEEIKQLKLQGDTALRSPEISKRLLVLEALKSLKEDQMVQSPVFQSIKKNLVDYIVDFVTLESTGPEDFNSIFDEAIKNGMREYRSSRYRFPEARLEQEVREDAGFQLNMRMNGTEPIVDEDTWGHAGKRASAFGGHPADPTGKEDVINKLHGGGLSLTPQDHEDDEGIPMVRNPNTGKMMRDPFAAKKQALAKGMMGESANLVKRLRHLLETEVSQAEVMMAAKGFAQELQEMVEKIGRLQNEDLPPVTDQMRETYGTDSASAFQTQIYGALQGIMDALYTAKSQVDDAVNNLATTGQVMAQVDMDADVGMDDGSLELDDLASELGDENPEDEFGGAEVEEPLGRAQKESISLEQKVLEMKKLVEKARKLKEGKK
jgi:hypothetical protein